MTGGEKTTLEVAIVGGGAAGLATAIFAARALPGSAIAVFDGAAHLGAKILVSGGGRCNVTNREVTERDFNGGSRHAIRRVLQALPVHETTAFFESLGVRLHEEAGGKVFPDSNRARTVLDALVGECLARGVRLLPSHRVTTLTPGGPGFVVQVGNRAWTARTAVLATGGLSLPRTGSDGFGLRLAQQLGHTLVATTPALVPLVLDDELHRPLTGISHSVSLQLAVREQRPTRVRGSLLWTHFGISGPAVLDMSRHWARAEVEGKASVLTLGLLPDDDIASADAWLLDVGHGHPRQQVSTALADRLPSAVGVTLCPAVDIDGSTPLSRLPRDARRRLARALVDWPLGVRGSRGYDHAEVTAGGVALGDVDPRTMHSRTCPGLFLVGEMLDVDGRLGGFNFQWAWASAKAAASGLAARLRGA